MKRSAHYHYQRTVRRSLQPLLRAVTVIASLTVLVTGVTFAALQSSQAKLAGNTIKTATADLKIGLNGTDFDNSQAGFAFNEVVPGATATPANGNTFYLKNTGSVDLALTAAVSSTPTNADNVDLSKVYLVLTRTDTKASQKLSLQSLAAANATGGTTLTDTLKGGTTAAYTAQVQMDSDAFTGSSADIGGIDIVFNGIQKQ